MFLIVERPPECYMELIRNRPNIQTKIAIQNKLSTVSTLTYAAYQAHCDHYFMIGYIAALRAVPCAGHMTVIATSKVHVVTGEVYVWSKGAKLAIEELHDILEGATKRFVENHPNVVSTITATITPVENSLSHKGSPPRHHK